MPFQAPPWPGPDFYREVAFLYSDLDVSPEDVILWATEAVRPWQDGLDLIKDWEPYSCVLVYPGCDGGR